MPTNSKIVHANKSSSSLPFNSGLSRRVFLQQTGTAALLAGLVIYKPCIAKSISSPNKTEASNSFSKHHIAVLEATQLQLFPADGDGPSARDLNALSYLEWALTDPKNREDGDRAFIIKGIVWLEELSSKAYKKSFTKLSTKQQHTLIQQLSESKKGDSWISLLVYYLLEALLLDPVYGGNTNEVGWKWLAHQPGFPRPTAGHNYQHLIEKVI